MEPRCDVMWCRCRYQLKGPSPRPRDRPWVDGGVVTTRKLEGITRNACGICVKVAFGCTASVRPPWGCSTEPTHMLSHVKRSMHVVCTWLKQTECDLPTRYPQPFFMPPMRVVEPQNVPKRKISPSETFCVVGDILWPLAAAKCPHIAKCPLKSH